MRVLLDLTQITLQHTGSGVYAENLLENIVPMMEEEGHQLVLLIQSDDTSFAAWNSSPAVRVLSLPARIFRSRVFRLFFEQTMLPLLAVWHRIDLIHSPHYTFPLIAPCPRVVTLHDFTCILWPQMHPRSRRFLFSFFIRQALKRAEGVFFVSEATRTDATRLFGTGRNLRRVTTLAAASANRSNPSKAEALDPLAQEPYILSVGTLEPRKNLPRLIRAFDEIAASYPDLGLVIVGRLGWHLDETMSCIRNSAFSDRIRHLGFVSDAEKDALLRGAMMLAYPSLYEGFGLPVLEALAAGVPVITSNISSLPEVAGEAALLVNPESVSSIAHAMVQLISDESLRAQLSSSGVAQAARFSWRRTATETLAAYKEIARKA